MFASSDADSFLQEVFMDVYSYALPAYQEQTINKIGEICTAFSSTKEACSEERITQLLEFCKRLLTLSPESVQNYEEAVDTCATYDEDTLRKTCSQVQHEGMNTYCEQLPTMSGREAFGRFMIYASKTDDNSSLQGLKSTLQTFNLEGEFITQYVIIGIITILFVVLVAILHKEPYLLFGKIGRIFLELGILLVIPYLLILLYVHYIRIDTSPILQMLINPEEGVQTGTIIKGIVPIVFQKIYPVVVALIGIVLAALGGIILLLKRLLKKKSKTLPIA